MVTNDLVEQKKSNGTTYSGSVHGEDGESGAESLLSVTRMVEEVLKCKWALSIISVVRDGTCRPGAIERSLAGLTTKVMNERLAKLVRFGVLERVSYPEVPPRVEYRLTPFGERFSVVLDAIADLERERL